MGVKSIAVFLCFLFTCCLGADFCDAGGHLTQTGRLWTLGSVHNDTLVNGVYTYILNLCGAYNPPCGSISVLCQVDASAGNTTRSLGDVPTGFVQGETNTTLLVNYTSGDLCPAHDDIARSILFTFTCSDDESPTNIISVAERPTQPCRYDAFINVPVSVCPQTDNTPPPTTTTTTTTTTATMSTITISTTTSTTGPPPDTDFCGDGYLSATSRLWTLGALGSVYTYENDTKYTYTLNLCGNSTSNCTLNSVLCQYDPFFNRANSLGDRSTSVVQEGDDFNIYLQFTGGTHCPSYNRDRSVKITVTCTGLDTAILSNITEDSPCIYTANLDVPDAYCKYTPATTGTTGTSTLSTTEAGTTGTILTSTTSETPTLSTGATVSTSSTGISGTSTTSSTASTVETSFIFGLFLVTVFYFGNF